MKLEPVKKEQPSELEPFSRSPSSALSKQQYPEFAPVEPSREEEPGLLLTYWKLIQRRKGAILIFGFLGILAAVLVTLPQTPVYQARTSLEIQGLNDNFLNMKSVDPTNALPDYSADAYIQTQMKILQSDLLVGRTMEKMREEHARSAEPPAKPLRVFGFYVRKPISFEQMLAATARNVQVRMAGSTHIVEVYCDSPSPAMASEFANILVRELVEHTRESRWKTTQDTGEWLTRQLQDVKLKLEKSEAQLQLYARNAGLQFTSDKSSVAEEKLRQLQQELSKAQADRVMKQSAYELALSEPQGTLPEVYDSIALREYQAKLVDLKRQRAELSATMTPANVKVKRVEDQITELQSALDKEHVRVLQKIHDEYETAERREKLLMDVYSSQNSIVTDQSQKGIQYDILKREVETNRQLYDSMLQRVKEAGISAAMRASNLSVVDEAKPPRMPYKPNIVWNGAMGLLGGIVLGIGLVTLRERSDRSIQDPGETNYFLNVPELGVIPAASANQSPSFYGSRQLTASKNGHGEEALEKLPDRVELVMCKRGPSLLAESFRATLASLLFSTQSDKKNSVFVLTSAAPGEGKTTIASNLAIAMAETRRRVLLIDADMRRPRLHNVFQTDSARGLSELLDSEDFLDAEILERYLHPTAIKGLTLLPSGPVRAKVSDLFYSARLPELMVLLREQFDAVIFDTPPVLQMPDARILARFTDGVIMVLRAGKTTRDTALIAKQRFREDGTPVLGTILNDWNPKKSAAYGYNGYYRDYHAYYGKKNGKAT